ncbi:MAG: hypothetical protein EAZ99_07035 [Alphaproteobacteria bacterium]|nr:MAG: hypothetical protein EAZ99_07035 [Alphaproteobacteria bacterium]
MTEAGRGSAAAFRDWVCAGGRPTQEEWFRVLPPHRKIADAPEWHACIAVAAAAGDQIAALWRDLLPITEPTRVSSSHWTPLPQPGCLSRNLLAAEVALARGCYDLAITFVEHSLEQSEFAHAPPALVDELYAVYLAAVLRSGDRERSESIIDSMVQAGRTQKLISVLVRLWNSHSFDELIWLAESVENRIELEPHQVYDLQRIRVFAAPLANSLSLDNLCRVSREYGEWIERLPIPVCKPKEPSSRSRLRVGILWADVSAGISVPALTHRDRTLYECILYTNHTRPSEYWQMVGEFDAVKVISDIDVAAAASAIVEDDLDILVVLDNLGIPNIERVITAKPAPKIAFYGNCLMTTGLRSVDAILIPPDLIEQSTRSQFSESIVSFDMAIMGSGYLPSTMIEPFDNIVTPPIIGTVASSFKLNRLWMERVAAILRAVPEATVQLDVYSPRLENGGYLLRIAEDLRISPDRLTLRLGVQFTPLAQRLAPLSLVIDTAPLGSNLTALQCLSAGVPLLTCPDERPGSRHAMTILRAIGEESLIATSEEDLVARAVALLTNREELRRLRRSLPDQVRSSGIADPFVVARVFESALLAVLGR